MSERGLGVDIGGSGIKGAPVDLRTGGLAGDRFRLPTPRPATPAAVAEVVRAVLAHFGWAGSFGCTFPGVVRRGVVRTAANVDRSWIGVAGAQLLPGAVLVNDADAAGVAEARFGAARGVEGVVLLCTLGTGIGSALLSGGRLVPNTELGHLELHGRDAESWAADSAREREDLSWPDWAARLSGYLQHVENLLWPDLVVLGGGVSKKAAKWLPLVRTRTRLVAAELRNNAGIVGAALLAAEQVAQTSERTSA